MLGPSNVATGGPEYNGIEAHYTAWAEQDGLLTFILDTAKNGQAIRDRVKLILKGCKGITGCKTGWCSCKESGRKCAEGCECISCLKHE